MYNLLPKELSLIVEKWKLTDTYLWDALPKVKTPPAFTYAIYEGNNSRLTPDGDYAEYAQVAGTDASMSFTTGKTLSKSDRQVFPRAIQGGYNASDISKEKNRLMGKGKDNIIKKYEKILATAWGSATTAASSADWNINSTPMVQLTVMKNDIVGWKKTFRKKIGIEPNTIVMPPSVHDMITSAVLDSGAVWNEYFGQVLKDGKLDFPTFMGMKIIVPNSSYPTGVSATPFTFHWTNYAWLAYIDPTPTTSLTTPSFGFIAESNQESLDGGSPWYVKPTEENAQGDWECFTSYNANWITTNSDACLKGTAIGGGVLVTA